MLEVNTTIPSKPQEPRLYSRHRFIFVCQWLAHRAGVVCGRLMMRSRHNELMDADLKAGHRYVIASNHQTYLDPWMVLSRLPMRQWKIIGLPRAMVANRFFDRPVMGNYLRSMGSFPAREHPRDPYGIDYADRMLDRGQSIVIFPEGKITLHRQNPAYRGVAILAERSDVRIIPMHLEWARPRWRLSLRVGIGKPFDGSKMTAEEILSRIYSLPVR